MQFFGTQHLGDKRKDAPIQLAKEEQNETGKYGDPKGKKIIDGKTEAFSLKTRFHIWRILLASSNGVCIVSDTIIEAAQQEAPVPRAPAEAHGADAFAAKPPLVLSITVRVNAICVIWRAKDQDIASNGVRVRFASPLSFGLYGTDLNCYFPITASPTFRVNG